MPVNPLNDWILVKLDPIETMVGSIFIPCGVDHRKATVEKVGPGKCFPNGVRIPVGVQVGDRVVFSRAHGEHKQGKQLLTELGGDYLLIKPEDILVVMEEEVEVT
jgi:chaperonin GroES